MTLGLSIAKVNFDVKRVTDWRNRLYWVRDKPVIVIFYFCYSYHY